MDRDDEVSPYLLRPLRRLEEVQAERAAREAAERTSGHATGRLHPKAFKRGLRLRVVPGGRGDAAD